MLGPPEAGQAVPEAPGRHAREPAEELLEALAQGVDHAQRAGCLGGGRCVVGGRALGAELPGNGGLGGLLERHLLGERERACPVEHVLEHSCPRSLLQPGGGIPQAGADNLCQRLSNRE